MRYLLGADEAGYGPNLGPLVISATVWEVPESVHAAGLFEHLRHVVAPSLDRAAADLDARVHMADSKVLYTPGNGLRRLELGLWAALAAIGRTPRTCREVWQVLAPEAIDVMPTLPWCADFDGVAPLDCGPAQVEPLATAFRRGLAAAGVHIVALRSRVIFAEEFNELVEWHGSKGTALSQQTLALTARMIAPLPASSIEVICDKHGGRNRYRPLLTEHFREWLIETYSEGRERSVYRFGPPERRVEFCFRTRGEACLPVALASMASKYLRELAMRALNAFWRRHVPDLRPTAGYPQDAKRFRADIGDAQRRLHIADRILWRTK